MTKKNTSWAKLRLGTLPFFNGANMVPNPSSFFFCVASCLQTPNKNLRFLLFFWTTSRKQKLCVFAEVLKAKAGDLYDLDCKQDVSFLVRKSFTSKQQRLKMVISEALLFTGESCPTSFLFLTALVGLCFSSCFWGWRSHLHPFADSIQ